MIIALTPLRNWLTTHLIRAARAPLARQRLTLDVLARPGHGLPHRVAACRMTRRYLELLGGLDWTHFPERDRHRAWPGPRPHPRSAYVAAFLIKVDQRLRCMSDLRRYLLEHPGLAWAIGFPLAADGTPGLPGARQFGRVLRRLDNAALQFLLTATVRLIEAEAGSGEVLGDVISLDTKHIIAWVKENNLKEHMRDRYLKERQPKGDPDCRLGCKERRNRPAPPEATPTTNPVPAAHLAVGQYYWGYASGVVVTRLLDATEVVLAELTQPFDQNDTTYFAPLMAQVEQRLGRRPRYGALDAAYDAFYVYDYFDQAGGFAAVPLTRRGGAGERRFAPDGAPLCQAGLPMTLRYAYQQRTGHVPHPRQRYACPLRFPQPTGAACPINHPSWTGHGCTATLAASPGPRLRYQIDRTGAAYRAIYNQRTAVERINAQAVDLDIERPRLRNRRSISNLNTLIYVVINLRALQRLQARRATVQEAAPMPRT
jgi:hypothetical protein